MLSRSIMQVSQDLQEGHVLASELCKASLNRVRHTKKLNAFVTLNEHAASEQAKASEARYLSRKPISRLDGVPIAVKDNFCTKGIKTTCASRMLEKFVSPYNATVVQRLLDSGAVLIGKSNLDEFAMGSGTVDSIHGPTKNVWRSAVRYKLEPEEKVTQELPNEDWFVAGGSSGGSAVAVASGACFAALGSDTGGSTRNPAAYCGVVGLKPSYGLVSRHGLIPLVNSMDVPGVLTRTVDDAALVLNTIAGWDPKDSTTLHNKFQPICLPKDVSVRGLRVGIPREYHCPGMQHQVLSAWSRVANLLEKAGAVVQQVSLPHTQHSLSCYSVLNQGEVASNMARYSGVQYGLRASEGRSTEDLYSASRRQGLNDVVRGRVLAGNFFLLSRNYQHHYMQALRVRRLVARDFAQVWRSVDVLLAPVTLSDAPLSSEFRAKDNRQQCAQQDFCTQPANLAGVPAISLPIELSEEGLPLSLQLMSPNFEEQKLLEVAKWIEHEVNFPKLTVIEDEPSEALKL